MSNSVTQKKELKFVESTDLLGEFGEYTKAILELVKSSSHNFSVGIYGEWGSGKTKLMKSIYKKIQEERNENNNIIIPIWFNAWQYEHEEYLALFPLLKTITEGIDKAKDKIGNINEKKLNELKQIMKLVLKGIVKTTPFLFSFLLPSSSPENIKELIKSASENYADEISTLLDTVNDEVNEHTIYSSGLKNIEDAMKKLTDKDNKNKINLKFVIFVDDTDRCSPKKAVQILESIKMFLDIDGFIFILGISYHRLSELIEKYYKGYSYEGKEYLNKIIQVPIFLPIWDEMLIKELITHLRKQLDKPYSDYIKDSENLIERVAQKNPREILTIINNLIFMFKLYEPVIASAIEKMPHIFGEKKKLIPFQFITLQLMSLNWNDLYQLLLKANDENADILLKEIEQYTNNKNGYIYNVKLLFNSIEKNSNKRAVRKIIIKHKDEEKFFTFLDDNKETLRDIFSIGSLTPEDYNVYLNAFRQITKLTSFKTSKITLEETEIFNPSDSNTGNDYTSKEIIKKEARGLEDDADFGEVQEILGEYIITQKGIWSWSKEKFRIPKNLVERFDGHTVYFKITKDESKKYKGDY